MLLTIRGGSEAFAAWSDEPIPRHSRVVVVESLSALAGANLTVLNGTQGLNEIVAGLVGQGMSILELLKKTAANGNGTVPAQVTEGRGPAGGPGGVADLN